MKTAATAFIAGFIFAIGLTVSGMTQPQKVLGFLDVMNWDPSLLFVMIGAIAVHAILYPVIVKRSRPLLAEKFHVPQNKTVNLRLIIGSVIFGVGWGMAGYCPGPAVVSLGALSSVTWVFVASMIMGMVLFHWLQHRYARR